MEHIKQAWSGSKTYRIVLGVTLVYALIRLAAQVAYLSGALLPTGYNAGGGAYVPPDMQVYLDAAHAFQQHRDLYLSGPLAQVEFFQYSPAFALAFEPFLGLSSGALVALHSALHVAAYAGLYLLWARLFRRLGLEGAARAQAALLPVWLVYSSFWADWAYLNIYVIMALLGTLLLTAVLEERLGWGVLWLTVILLFKPQWAFAAALPLLLGRTRFFARLLGWSVAAYAAVVGVMMLGAGTAYVWRQFGEYVNFLLHLASDFPWRGPEAGFPGYNHSITQTLVFWLGDGPAARLAATAVKVVLTAPLALVCLRLLRQPPGDDACLVLDLTFALYLGVFLWLDWVWELSLGPAVFTYLWATSERRPRAWLLIFFLPLALSDLWQFLSVAALGERVVAGAYILTDPGIYVPVTLIVLLLFYAVTVRRLRLKPAAYAPAMEASC